MTNLKCVFAGDRLEDLDKVKLEATEKAGVLVFRLNPESLSVGYGKYVSDHAIHSCLMVKYLKSNFCVYCGISNIRQEFLTDVVDTLVSKLAASIPGDSVAMMLYTSAFSPPFDYRGPTDRIAIAYQQLAESQMPRPTHRGSIPCFKKFIRATKSVARTCEIVCSSRSKWCWYRRPDGVRRFALSVLYGGETYAFYSNCRHARTCRVCEELGGSVFEVYFERDSIVITDAMRIKGEPCAEFTVAVRNQLLSSLELPSGFRIAQRSTDVNELRRGGPPESGAIVFSETDQSSMPSYAWKQYKILGKNQAFLELGRRQILYSAAAAQGAGYLKKQAGEFMSSDGLCPMVYLCRWIPEEHQWKVERAARKSETRLDDDITVRLIKSGRHVGFDSRTEFGFLCDALESRL